jgi:HK97 family phage major capsid protein
MDTEVKRLYDEANQLYARAKSILDEFKGKDMPADKSNEVDTLLDQVDSKTADAKRRERVSGAGDFFNQPATDLPINSNGGAKGAGVSVEIKSLLKGYGYHPAAIERFADDNEAKIAIANALYWKTGEKKDLATSPATSGGYLVADTQRAELIQKQDPVSAMRRIARVLPAIPGGASITPSADNDLSDAEWTTEIKSGSNDTVKPFGGRVLNPKPLAKRIKISNTELRAGKLYDVENWVLTRMAVRFAVPEENAFINGVSSNGPMGLLGWSGISKYTTAASNTLAADDVINWAYSLPASYMGNAKILCNRSFLRKVRLFKSVSNEYLWQPGLSSGTPNKILDWQYEVSDQYPTGLDTNDAYKDNELVATIGDFQYYWIVDSLNLSIVRADQLYLETDQTGFIGRKETDGMPVLAEAFYHLKIKA